MLQMLAAKEFGEADWAHFDPYTVALSHPDARACAHKQHRRRQLRISPPRRSTSRRSSCPGVHLLTTNYEILGGPATAVVIAASAKYRDANPKSYKSLLRRAERSHRRDQQGQACGGEGLPRAGEGHQEQRGRHLRDDRGPRLRVHADAAEGLQDGGVHEQDRDGQAQAGVVEGPVLPRSAGPCRATDVGKHDAARAHRQRRRLPGRPARCRADARRARRARLSSDSNASASARSRWRSCAAARTRRRATTRCSSAAWSACCRLLSRHGIAAHHQHGRGQSARRRRRDHSHRARAEASRSRSRWSPATTCSAQIAPTRRSSKRAARFADYGEPISANAYLGVAALLPALETGADIVITGRVADPSLFLAPIAHRYGWSLDDFDRLARGTCVGHLLECAGQLTGGYFADPGAQGRSRHGVARISLRRRRRRRQPRRSARSRAPAARSASPTRRSSSSTRSRIRTAT